VVEENTRTPRGSEDAGPIFGVAAACETFFHERRSGDCFLPHAAAPAARSLLGGTSISIALRAFPVGDDFAGKRVANFFERTVNRSMRAVCFESKAAPAYGRRLAG